MLFSRLRRFLAGASAQDGKPIARLEKKMSQLEKKVDLLTKRNDDDRLLLRRIGLLLEQGRNNSDEGSEQTPLSPPVIPPSAPGDWNELRACPLCGHASATLVCEYNRFVVMENAPDEPSKIYNYSLCHGCGMVYAARRPIGRRYRELLTGFHENLGRPGAPSVWLNPGALSDGQREDIRRRAGRGALVSEHADVASSEWISGAFRDRLASAQHVELLGSLLPLQKPRVLEIRSRSGAILDSLRRLYGASVYAMPIFESQQEVIRGLYDIRADALIDFERFRIPYPGPFDLVISNHMITHAVAPGEFLDAIFEALAPGGHLYLYNEMDETEFLGTKRSMFRTLNPFHMQVFNGASLSRALASRGFEVVFLGHSDRIHMLCLARKALGAGAVRERGPLSQHWPVGSLRDPTLAKAAHVAIEKPELKRRLKQYRTARDISILGLPVERRVPFASEWDAVVERSLISGAAKMDDRGRLKIAGQRREEADERWESDADV